MFKYFFEDFMNLNKKLLAGLAVTLSLTTPIQANAGIFKKVVKGGLIIGAGVVAYKIIQKLNIGSVTQNLSNYPDNVVPYLTKNPGDIPKVKDDLEKIFNDPEMTPEKVEPPTKYFIIAQTLDDNFGTDVNKGPWEPYFPGAKENSVQKPNATTSKPSVIAVSQENEDLLEKNMTESGYGNKPQGFKAFHIVGDNNRAKTILIATGIDVNSAINGVYISQQDYNKLKNSADYLESSYQQIKSVHDKTKNKIAVENKLRDLNKELSK